MGRFNRRKILFAVVGCGITAVIVAVGIFIIIVRGIAGFSEYMMNPGCGWVTDAESFAEYADVAIPATATDRHFSGCSYGQGLVVAARFEMPKDSPDLAEFIADIEFDQPLISNFEYKSDFSRVYEGEGWWQPLPTQNYVGGHVVRSEALTFYDILVESQPDADIVYILVEIG